MTPTPRYQLKKPLLVYAMGVCFMLAPVVDVFASMIALGIPHWYYPNILFRWLREILPVDQAWLALTFLAGMALFRQRRSSWLFAVGSLLVASGFNIYYGLTLGERFAAGRAFPYIFMLANLGVVVVLYHFRYPYLDRREAWWGMHPRFACDLPARAGDFSGSVANISRSGAFIRLKGASFECGREITCDLGTLKGIRAEVMRVDADGFGVRFHPTREHSQELLELIKALRIPPMAG